MKKIIFGVLLLFAAATQVKAQDYDKMTQQDTTGTKYWYYPSQNVYFNEVTGDYFYYDEPTVRWSMVRTLPGKYAIAEGSDRYAVYYKGNEVWKENKNHKMKYKVKKDGTVKEKPKP